MTDVSEYSDVEYVFEPHSNAVPDVRQYLRALWDRRQFMHELATSDLQTERSGKALGNLWRVLNPLIQSAIYYFLYTVLRRGGNNGFLPILISNFFFFGLSIQALGEGGSSLKRGKGLMLNSAFPRALLPVTTVYKNLRAFVPAVCVLVVLFPLLGGNVGPGLFVLPLLFAIQVTMNVGLALAAATYVSLVPDGENVVSWITRVLFFATPVIYPVALLPPAAKAVLQFSPLYPVFAAYQAIFGGQSPNPALIAMSALWAVALVLIGGRAFLRHEREFALYL
jgi:teichoic acid transport system permease protein